MTRIRRIGTLVVCWSALAAPHAFAQKSGGATVAPSEGDGDDDTVHKDPPPKPPKEKEPLAPKIATVMRDGMVRIPGGTFTMGSSEKGAAANERPAHTATAPAFWIDRIEVTVGAYRACVERGACQKPIRASQQCTYDVGDPMLPVNCVSWTLAKAYCRAVGKRLPREVEWEHAARGPSTARYPWGGAGTSCGMAATLAREGTSRACSGKWPAKAGAHTMGASPFGVLDMSGNVEEWVDDWYAESVEASPRAGSAHVLRGGGWLSSPAAARTTARNWGSVRESGPNVGFRCAKDDSGP